MADIILQVEGLKKYFKTNKGMLECFKAFLIMM